ncbi:hypothetical protein KC346_g21555, partial [Hortaea werneckii]
EGYIKKLEEQVKDFQNMEQNFRSLQNENYQLREYILNLQSRLLETQSDIPPAPSHVNLSASSASQAGPSAAGTADGHGGAAENPQQHRREMPPPGEQGHDYHAMSQLQAAAAQAEAAGPHPMHSQQSQQHQPHGPYGLGMPTEYPPAKRPRTEEEGAQGRVDDTKPEKDVEFRVALRLVFVALHFFLGTENRWAIQEDIKLTTAPGQTPATSNIPFCTSASRLLQALLLDGAKQHRSTWKTQ